MSCENMHVCDELGPIMYSHLTPVIPGMDYIYTITLTRKGMNKL